MTDIMAFFGFWDNKCSGKTDAASGSESPQKFLLTIFVQLGILAGVIFCEFRNGYSVSQSDAEARERTKNLVSPFFVRISSQSFSFVVFLLL